MNAARLETGELTRIARGGVAIFVVGVLGLGSWLVLAPLSGAVIAPGFVKVDMNRKLVQHQEGGIVKQVLVRDGEKVRQGQILVVIDDVRLDATLDLLRTQHDGERAKAARLEAERAFLPEVKFPAELSARRNEPKVAELLQRAILRLRQQLDAHGRGHVEGVALRLVLLARLPGRAVVAEASAFPGTFGGAVIEDDRARLLVLADHVWFAAGAFHLAE